MATKAKKQVCPITGFPCGFVGNKTVPGEGPATAEIALVGESPGATELNTGRPFVGKAGQLLNSALEKCGVVRSDCYIDNACACNTTPIRTPAASEWKACRKRLITAVASRKPRVVVALGAVAMKSLLPGERRVTEVRGEIIYSEEVGAYVIPTVHPAAVLRNPALWDAFVRDVKKSADFGMGRVKVGVEAPKYHVATRPEELQHLVGARKLALDTEGVGNNITCVGLSADGKEVIVVPDTALESLGMRYAMKRVLHSADKILAHNWQHDQRVLAPFDVLDSRPPFEDTMLQSYVLDEKRGTHGLKYLSREYLNVPTYDSKVRQYLKEQRVDECPKGDLYQYNAWDVANTFNLEPILSGMLDTRQRKLLDTLLYPASDALSLMTHTGIMVDPDMLQSMDVELTERLDDIVWQIHELAGVEFNLNSWRQVADVLYERLGLPVPFRLSTDKEALETLEYYTGHPVPHLMLCYRKDHKMLSTYVRGLNNARDVNNRVRTNFNLIGTVTGRLSSADPVNLQNITRGGLRDVFAATPGYSLIECDLSQAEVRMACWYARDVALKETLLSGVDVHTRTACLMFNKRAEQVTEAMRTAAKRITFGLLYMMSPGTLAKELRITTAEATKLVAKYFDIYPRVKEWMSEVRRTAVAGELFYTPFGRTRHFGLVTRENRNEVEREAVNTPIQSGASDITLSALIRLDKRIRRGDFGKTRLLLTVHDSILPETAEKDVVAVALAMKEEIERDVLDGWLPFPADVKIGQRWGSLKKVKHGRETA